ncbi:MAG: radical SAM protein [Lachnospiraceae bacterium]|nr:radical SAM protein [Lachnospiraceae bacterium]
MRTMYLAVGYRCNHNCYFCPCGKDKRTDSVGTEKLLEAVEHAVDCHGIEGITISGGEPTLHPGFSKLVAYCVDKGLETCILSNGENFCDRDRVRQYFGETDRSRLEVVTAFHSFRPQVHEELNGTPGSFDRTVTGLKNLLDDGIAVTVKQILCRQNYRDLPEFTDFVYDTFGGSVSFDFCGMDYCGISRDRAEEVFADFRDIGRSLEDALDRIDRYRRESGAFRRVAVTDFPLCSTDPLYWRFFLASSRNGSASYAMPGKDGDSMYQAADLEGDCGTYYEACENCLMNRQCPGVWRYTAKYFPDAEKIGIRSVRGVDAGTDP